MATVEGRGVTFGAEAIRWAPRVSRNTIRRLYESDARGFVDEELIDEVAFAFFARCQSILTVTEAARGRVACLGCGTTLQRTGGTDEVVRCEACDWQVTWAEYLKSYQHMQLMGGAASEAFRSYMERLPGARSPRARMVLVDWLVHQLHISRLTGYGRPAAVNVIQGKVKQVVALLDDLAAAPGSSSESRQAHESWRGRLWPGMQARRQ